MKSSKRKGRTKTGIYLIECLVALILSAFYCFTLLQLYAQSLRVGTTNDNKQQADLIAQTVLDAFKSSNINNLAPGSYDLGGYNATAGSVSPGGGHPLPPGLDFGDLTWVANVQRFPGSVNLTISTGPDANSYNGLVTVSWSDDQSNNKIIQTMSLLEKQGVNYWQ